jgi:hypothetical protein
MTGLQRIQTAVSINMMSVVAFIAVLLQATAVVLCSILKLACWLASPLKLTASA